MIPALLSVIIAFSILGTAVVEITMTNFSVVGNSIESEAAFNAAEAGLNYYMWHLNHNPTDYKDGGTTPATPDANLGYGPYTHNYIDTNGLVKGTYTLWLKPAGNGSTIVTVRSIGQAAGTNIKRTVQAQIGSPSFASYALVADSEFWFGSSESANGPIFSNVGIHLDGPNSDVAGSANATYKPSSAYGGDGNNHNGVWCSSSVTTPVNCNTRNKSNWIYPSPAVDFNKVSTSLCTMKKVALADYASTASIASQANACTQTPATQTSAYIPQLSSTFTTTKGYLIKLNANGTYDLLKVNSENDTLTPYTSALNTTAVSTNNTLPPSGVIFVEDNVWVLTPTNFHGRVTIAAGRLATTNSANIVIAGNLLYSTKNGSDAIGLVAEDSILVAPYAPPTTSSFNYEIDGALLAQSGSVVYGEYQNTSGQIAYRSSTSKCARGWVGANQTLTFYGSIATRQPWTWNQTLGGACGDAVRDAGNGRYWSGIERTATNYDYNLEYAPPPSYPLTSGYNILSWREILTHP